MRYTYPEKMPRVYTALLLVLLSITVPPAQPQNAVPGGGATQAKDQYFTGVVVAIDSETLTVNRKASGKQSATKSFLITAETQFEGGKPVARSQVTVRYVTTDDGDRAVHVILRRGSK